MVMLYTQVAEGEDTLGTFVGGAGVGHSLGGLGAGELEGRASDGG